MPALIDFNVVKNFFVTFDSDKSFHGRHWRIVVVSIGKVSFRRIEGV